MTAYRQVRPALVLLSLFMLITGVAYPLAVTAIAWMLFPAQAAGSVLVVAGRPVGSTLIGQPFTEPGTFWSRPSATQPFPYNAAASGGSNLAPTSETLLAQVQARVDALHAADPAHTAPVPVDLVTASASGLDPHISPAAAEYQVARVARARGLDEDQVRALVAGHTQGRLWGVLGEPRVNVLELNLALDALHPQPGAAVQSAHPRSGR